MLRKTYHVNPSASAGGNGSEGSPFNSVLLVPFVRGVHTTIKIGAGTETLPAQWVIPAYTTIEGERGSILSGGDKNFYGVIRVEDATSVTIRDLTLERARHGLLIMGAAQDVLIERVTCQDMHGLGGFAHEDTNTAQGRVVFKECKALRCEGDGFSNRGGADDLLIDCQAVHCGPIWGVRELDFKIEELRGHADPRLRKIHEAIDYKAIATKRPTITRNIYLDTVNGDDSNDGLSANSAWATVDKVNTSGLAGDRINIACGSTMTGTGSTATLALKTDQEVKPFGTGPRPYFNTFNNEAITVTDGVKRVWVEGMDFKDCGPGVLVTGDVEHVWVVDCTFNQQETYGIQANDASGSGDINIFKCGFFWNNDGSVHATAGSYVLTAWDCKGTDNARSDNTTGAAAWLAGGSCRMVLHGVWEDDPYYRGFALGGSADHTVSGCWVNDPQDNSAVTTRKGIEVSSTGTTEIRNTVVGIADPGAGEDTIGVHQTAGTLNLFNDTFQDTRNTGGSGSSSVTVAAGVAGFTMRNCLFDAENGNAGTVYVTLDATATGVYDIDYNAYHDWSGAGTLNGWYDTDAAAAIGVLTWIAIDGNTEDDGSTGVLLTNQATTNLPATVRPSDARIDDLNTTAIWKGQDLKAAGLVTWEDDAGFRTRNQNPEAGWTIGAWENSTGSPDGATTHADSGMRLERFDVAWCQNGIDFTHDHVTTDEECGVYDSIFFECYDGAVETAFTRPFPFRGCRFIGGIGPAIDINPPSGATNDVWYFEACEFIGVAADSMVKLRSSAAITVNLTSCVFWGPETSWFPVPTVAHQNLLELGTGAVSVNLDNSVFWIPTGRNVLSTLYGIRIQSGNTGTLEHNNNLFFAQDSANTQYIRADSATRVGSGNRNLYWEAATNQTNFRAGGVSQNLAAWQAGTSSDANAWETTDKVCAFPDIGEWRYASAEDFRIFDNTDQATTGVNGSAQSRLDLKGALRPSTGNWGIGPFAARASEDTLFRDDRSLKFSEFVLGSRYSTDFKLGDFEDHQALEVALANQAGAALEVYVHEGLFEEGRIVWSGVLDADRDLLCDDFFAPKGSLYISFGGTSGTLQGSVSWGSVDEVFPPSFGDNPFDRKDLTPRR